MDTKQTAQLIDKFWENQIIPTISRYIEIPNQSPLFDPEWRKTGHMHRAINLVRDWVVGQNIADCHVEIVEDGDRTPVLFLDVKGASDDTVLLYGHLDKQPAMTGWEEGLSPWVPVRRDGKLYGRGSADDGYAIFSVVSAIKALREQKVPHSRLVVLIECCEESGSVDLPYYVDKLADRIGNPSLIICLDSGCGNYESFWTTTSLRGSVVGNLTVEVLTEGVHSGDASGIVPSSFRILRMLLERIEDAQTGKIKPEWLWSDVPANRMEELKQTAKTLKDEVWDKFPFIGNMQPVSKEPLELLLNRNWRPALSYTGQEGMPDLVQGGNVLRPKTSLKLSLRLPPTLNAEGIEEKLKNLLESDPPYGAKVTFDAEKAGAGWSAPKVAPWLEKSIEKSARAYFGTEPMSFGEGGSIPFMGMLSERFPEAQFLVTGVLGPHSNAHGPNEFLHIQMGKNVTAVVASVLADFQSR